MSESNHAPAVDWRHRIHAEPELGFAEVATSALIAELLGTFGFEVHTGIGGTGVVGVLRAGSSSASIGLRADMDAIPIDDIGTQPYRSTRPGAFHGCGHDGHVAMLLDASRRLAHDPRFDGSLHVIFQPCEERGLGAQAMIDDGLFDRFPMDAIYGMHNMPGIPMGEFHVREGPMMSFEDGFVIGIEGRGGHASMPDRTVDPTVVAAEVILALQTIVARSLSALDAGVVSVTGITTDGAPNVIPSTVTISGDALGFTPATQATIERRMREIAAGICAAHGASATVSYSHDFVVLHNSALETAAAADAARSVVADPAMVDPQCTPAPCSEDFARMLDVVPGAYVLIGNGAVDDGDASIHGLPLHNPGYDFNDAIIPSGSDYWVALVTRQLA